MTQVPGLHPDKVRRALRWSFLCGLAAPILLFTAALNDASGDFPLEGAGVIAMLLGIVGLGLAIRVLARRGVGMGRRVAAAVAALVALFATLVGWAMVGLAKCGPFGC